MRYSWFDSTTDYGLALVLELVDKSDLKSGSLKASAGSIPA